MSSYIVDITSSERVKATDTASGIAILPPEVLGQIFIRTLPSFEKYEVPSIRSPPIVLCFVSKLWREVALGTPQLWNTIRLGSAKLLRGPVNAIDMTMDLETNFTEWSLIHTNKHTDPSKDGFFLSKYIERSGMLPLSLALIYLINNPSLMGNDPAPGIVGALAAHEIPYKKPFDIALKHIDRWQHIILASHVLNREYIGTFFPDPLPFLETLHLASTKIDSVVLTNQPLIPPRAFTFDEDIHRPSQIWFPNLRSLTITGASLSMADLFLLFMHTPLLESCTVELYRGGHLAFGPELLILPKLKKLDLLVGRDFDLGMLLDRLILPILECLTLTAAGMSSRPIWVDAGRLLKRSTKIIPPSQLFGGAGNVWDFKMEDIENLPEKESTLKELRLFRHPMTPMPPRDVLECLKAAPNIEVLHLQGAYLTDEVLAGLTLTMGRNINEDTYSASDVFPEIRRESESFDRTRFLNRSFMTNPDSIVRGRVLSIESARRVFGMGTRPPPLDYCSRLKSIRFIFPGAFLFSGPGIRRMVLSRCEINNDTSVEGNSSDGTNIGSLNEVHISKCNPEVAEYVLRDVDIARCMARGLNLTIRKSLGGLPLQ